MRWPYEELFRAATTFAWELNERGVQKGDRVLLWAENSGWWVAAFLGCMLAGAVCVPMDLGADEGFAQRVAGLAAVRLAVLGKGLAHRPAVRHTGFAAREFSSSREKLAGKKYFLLPPIAAGDPLQIVFTSGTTAEPRGVVAPRTPIFWRISSQSSKRSSTIAVTNASFTH